MKTFKKHPSSSWTTKSINLLVNGLSTSNLYLEDAIIRKYFKNAFPDIDHRFTLMFINS